MRDTQTASPQHLHSGLQTPHTSPLQVITGHAHGMEESYSTTNAGQALDLIVTDKILLFPY